MDDSRYPLVVDDAPEPADLALLEERVARAAIEAAQVGEDRPFGIFMRNAERRIVAGISGVGHCGQGRGRRPNS